MKILRPILISSLVFLLVGCAADNSSPLDAYKNQSAKQILNSGETALQKGDYKEAAKHLEALDALYPFGTEAEQGQLEIIYAYFQAENYDEAVTAAERYIHLYPRGAHADYAYYMQGLSNFQKDESWWQRLYKDDPAAHDLSAVREAFNNFNELVREFPSSKFAPDARTRMIYIRNVIASHELEVAKFYFERKAYVASANRAINVVRHFEGVPQMKEALQLLIKSYRALGADAQADEAERVYRLNYGDTKLVKSEK